MDIQTDARATLDHRRVAALKRFAALGVIGFDQRLLLHRGHGGLCRDIGRPWDISDYLPRLWKQV